MIKYFRRAAEMANKSETKLLHNLNCLVGSWACRGSFLACLAELDANLGIESDKRDVLSLPRLSMYSVLRRFGCELMRI